MRSKEEDKKKRNPCVVSVGSKVEREETYVKFLNVEVGTALRP